GDADDQVRGGGAGAAEGKDAGAAAALACVRRRCHHRHHRHRVQRRHARPGVAADEQAVAERLPVGNNDASWCRVWASKARTSPPFGPIAVTTSGWPSPVTSTAATRTPPWKELAKGAKRASEESSAPLKRLTSLPLPAPHRRSALPSPLKSPAVG